MRRLGHLSGNMWNRHLHEMVKVHRKPTNASKSSGKCASRSLPLSKSMSKTKGRNKHRAFTLRDEWAAAHPPASRSTRAHPPHAHYHDHDSHPDVGHAQSCISTKDSPYKSPAVTCMPSFSSGADESSSVFVAAAAASTNPPRTRRRTDRDGIQGVYHDVSQASLSVHDGCNTSGETFSRPNGSPVNLIDDPHVRNGYDDHTAKDCLFPYNDVYAAAACRSMCTKHVLPFEEMFVETADATPGHESGAGDWDCQLIASMVGDIILGNSDNCATDMDASGTIAYPCHEDHTLSNKDSDKSSIDEEWCHVSPYETISDDWYLC